MDIGAKDRRRGARAMPERETRRRADADKRAGKSASTQAGEFVREEIHHIREGKHGARSAKQAIAIGLSKARRAGVDLPPPPGEEGKPAPKRKAAKRKTATSRKRSRAARAALEHEGHAAGSSLALSRHATAAARTRTPEERSASAKKAARTKGSTGRKAAARKAARTRASHEKADSKN
jgi:Family of unknown function (DUF6496)